MSELLAPAGNLKVAIEALNSHADAIYVGLKSFSARKGANNFSEFEFRRVLGLAKEKNKKIYVTLNTVILENELEELHHILNILNILEVDGVIIQDFGLLHILKTQFPNINIHASTQMGIHNVFGARQAYQMGIKRVVLSRETTFEMIEEIRREVPELELEVFVHGALCYSFSGMCLASGLFLERSANKGGCAQICRTMFNKDNGENGSYFSCNDLALYENVKQLRDIGVASFKIEGRMKSASYVTSLLNLYNSILTDKPYFEEVDKSLLTFSRNTTSGYFNQSSGVDVINASYAGHRGLLFGSITKIEQQLVFHSGKFNLKPFSSIAIFRNGKFVVGEMIKDINKNKNAFYVQKPHKLKAGDEIRLLADQKQKDISIDEKQYPYYSKDISVGVIIEDDLIIITHNDELISKFDFEMSEAKKLESAENAFSSHFSKIGEQLLTFNVLKYENKSKLEFPFIPNSIIKKVKKELISYFLEQYMISPFQPKEKSLGKGPVMRKELFLTTGFPFVQDELDLNEIFIPTIEDTFYIPLSPLDFDENFLISLTQFVEGKKVVIGLNNISHLKVVEHLKDNVSYFLDFYFYIGNSYSLDFALSEIPNLKFAYGFCEVDVENENLTTIEDKKCLPLFLSKSCYKKNSGADCFNCNKDFTENLTNNEKFVVKVKRCLTYFFFN